MRHLIPLVGFLFFCVNLVAAPLVSISGPVELVGDGCTPSDSDSVVSSDRTSLSVLFSQFSASAEDVVRHRRTKRSCAIRVPLRVASGYRIRVRTADYRGFVQLETKSVGRIATRVSLRDRHGKRHSRFSQNVSKGPKSEEVFLNPSLSVAMKDCGGNVELTFHQQVLLRLKSRQETGGVALDSFDFTTDPSISPHLSLERCSR